MATSVLTAANDHHQPANTSLPQTHQDHDQHQPPIRRSCGRRKSKLRGDSSAGSKKKTPRRGMGVEKLQKLMLEERWRKMTEINSTNQPAGICTADPFADPAGLVNAHHVPVQVSKLAGFAGPNSGQMGLNVMNRPSNPSCNLGFHHGQMGHVSGHHQFQADLFGNECLNNPGFVIKNVNGFSKELSSIPNVVKCHVPELCNACHKKKKLVGGENLGGGRMIRPSDMYKQMYNVVECGFGGINVGDNRTTMMNQENQGLRISATHVGYPDGNGKQGVEVVAVHRKLGGGSSISISEGGIGNITNSDTHVLMEYEFFPSSVKSEDDDLVMMNQKMLVSSNSETSSDGFDAAASKDSIDLSLKLSY